MNTFLVLLLFALFCVFIYLNFSRSYKQWQDLILSSGYKKQSEVDDKLSEDLKSIFDPQDVLDTYKMEEKEDSSSWIIEADTGSSDDLVLTYIVLSVKYLDLPPIILSNQHYSENKFPKTLKSIYEKATRLGNRFAKENDLKLLANMSDSFGLPTFLLMARHEDDLKLVPSIVRENLQNWPSKKLDTVIFAGSYVVILPSGPKRVVEWQRHLSSKDGLLQVLVDLKLENRRTQ